MAEADLLSISEHSCILQVSAGNVLKTNCRVVGIATGYGLHDRGGGVRVPVESRIFTSPYRPDRLWGQLNPAIQWVLGALSPGVNQQVHEGGHSPPTSAEVKKTWIYTSISLYVLMT
jgi:hypothetical protein